MLYGRRPLMGFSSPKRLAALVCTRVRSCVRIGRRVSTCLLRLCAGVICAEFKSEPGSPILVHQSTFQPASFDNRYLSLMIGVYSETDLNPAMAVRLVEKVRADSAAWCENCSLRGGGENRLLLCKACRAKWYCVSVVVCVWSGVG